MKWFIKGENLQPKFLFLPTRWRCAKVCQHTFSTFWKVFPPWSLLWFLALFLNTKVLFLADSITYLAPLELFVFVEKMQNMVIFVANSMFLQVV